MTIWTRQPQIITRAAHGLRPPKVLINFSAARYGHDVTNSNNTLSSDSTTGSKESRGSKWGPLLGRADSNGAGVIVASQWSKFNSAIAASGAASAMCLVRSADAGGFGSGNVAPYKLYSAFSFHEHYPFTDGKIYIGPFSATRWVSAVTPPSSITTPHVDIVTATSGAQRFYYNGVLSASGSIAETPAIGQMDFGGQGILYLFAAWDYVLSPAQIAAYTANPWQLFAELDDDVLFAPSVAGNLTLAGESTDLTLTGQTATANLSFLGSEATATLTGQTATTNLSLVGTNATATLTGQDGTFSLTGALTLAGETTDLSLTGQTATANVTLVGSDGSLSLTGQTATTNINLVGTVGDLTLTGYDGTFTVGGPLTLTGTSADLTLVGSDGEFVLSGQTRGGRGKAKIKKRRRLVTADDTSDLLEVIQDLEEEKLALQKVQEKQKKELTKKEPLQKVLTEVVETLKAEESAEVAELKALTVLVSRVEVMAQTIIKLEQEIETLEKHIDENHGKMVKKVQQLEDLVIILNNA